MYVIVVDEKKAEREGIVLALQKSLVSVEAVADMTAAVAAIARKAPSVALVSWPASGATDMIRMLRGADASGQLFIVAILEPNPGGRDIHAVIAAGAHDFVRRPVAIAELLARAQAPERLLKWARSVSKSATFDLSRGPELASTQMWKNFGPLICEDLGTMVGQVVDPTPGWPRAFVHDLRGATITMSLALDRIALQVSVMGDRSALKWLGKAVLGDAGAPEVMIADMLREMANAAGGALKRAALPENITLTTGIPSNATSIRFEGPRVQSWTLPLDGGKANLAIVGEIRESDNQRLPVTGLREGMVLAHDLRTESGALLVTAGSRLTATTAQRLAQVLGPRFVVEVATAG